MKSIRWFPLFVLLFLAVVVVGLWVWNSQNRKSQFSFTILQLNDVYEIAPLMGTNEGGMARVATVRNKLLQKDPNTITMLAGDFVSPSFIGTLSYNDSVTGTKQQILGKQMVETMNALGVDYVTFGNHEFDIPVSQLQKRMNESDFTWISSNVLQRTPHGIQPFIKHSAKPDTVMSYAIHELSFEDYGIVKVGIIGVTLPFNKSDSIVYKDIYTSVQETYDRIRPRCDVTIALTHLDLAMDSTLAVRIPELDLIIGGHEHEHNRRVVGNVPICKADANAKSVYIHTITFDSETRAASVSSHLSLVNGKVPSDPVVSAVVSRWMDLAYGLVRDMGYDPDRKLMRTAVRLDGRESEIRNHETNYTALISKALLWAEPSCDVALFNSGSLRLDDQLIGDITEYDVLRSFPFGGPFVVVGLKGSDLLKILETGLITNKGSGGYLQVGNVSFEKEHYLIGHQPLVEGKTYAVLMPEFVAMGKESNLGFIKTFASTKPENFRGEIENDIVDIVVAYMSSVGAGIEPVNVAK